MSSEITATGSARIAHDTSHDNVALATSGMVRRITRVSTGIAVIGCAPTCGQEKWTRIESGVRQRTWATTFVLFPCHVRYHRANQVL